MEFLTLGIGSATPHLSRYPSASILQIDNSLILIDCGEGTQYRLLENKVRIKKLKYIVISHLHGDHYYGLVALLSSLSMGKRTEPLHVFGPNGLKEIISIQLKYADSKINFPLFISVIDPKNRAVCIDDDRFTITSFTLKHRVDCTGFLFEEKPAKRKVRKEMLPENFSIENIKMLISGQDVFDDDSQQLYRYEEYTFEPHQPTRFAYCSDTIFDREIIQYVQGVDLLYHEATFTSELENRAQITFHATAAQAATIALEANVSQLILGHFSARYESLDGFLEEAQAIFPNSILAEQGKTVII